MPIESIIIKKGGKEIHVYRCEICKMPFDVRDGDETARNSALECEAKGAEPFLYNVGDRVLVKDDKEVPHFRRGKDVKITEQIYYIGTHKKEYSTDPRDSLVFLAEEDIEKKVS